MEALSCFSNVDSDTPPPERMRYMTTSEIALNDIEPSSGPEPINKQRRMFLGGALAALLASPRRAMADYEHGPNDPMILLLHGIYQPVPIGKGPADNLNLTTINLSDGSFSTTQIYPIYNVDGTNDQKKVIGTFYVQFAGNKCAYDLPGGSLLMQFNSSPVIQAVGFNTFVPVPDGQGGLFLEGTFELVILEATGVYAGFKGGHNHMVDKLHRLSNGQFDEFCFCNISTYQFP
jgi:hypothetical protein